MSNEDFEEKLFLNYTPQSLSGDKLLENALIFGISFIHKETKLIISFFLQENTENERISVMSFLPEIFNRKEVVNLFTKVLMDSMVLSLHDQIMEDDLISSKFKD